MDPLKPGNIPLTEEWFRQQKKLLKSSGIEQTTAAHGAPDVYTPSEAARQLPSSPEEKFLAQVRQDILQMDPRSEAFIPQATGRLVDSALEQEFGSGIAEKPGYPQMKHKITRTILQDERHREIVEDFLAALLASARQAGLSRGEEPPSPAEG